MKSPAEKKAKIPKRNNERRAQGLCHNCQKDRARPGKSNCERCTEREKQRIEDRVTQGMCGHCGLRPLLDGLKTCEECAAIRRERKAKKRLFRDGDGLCVVCESKPARDGLRTCLKCSQRCNDYSKKNRENKKISGKCIQCGISAILGKTLCEDCAKKFSERAKELKKERLSKGLCAVCGEPSADRSRCDKCRILQYEREITRKARRLKDGVCVKCGKHPACVGKQMCKECVLKSICTTATGNSRNIIPLSIKLNTQNFTCPYTGIRLVIGVNASLDHIVPKTKGGSNDIDNLEWTDLSINRLKSDRTKEEFMPIWRSLIQAGARHLYGIIL